eukprot:6494994-Alexandrium_andersonii.AAC.1
MSASLVGSEMCIRDRQFPARPRPLSPGGCSRPVGPPTNKSLGHALDCLLYTSDAATICSV